MIKSLLLIPSIVLSQTMDSEYCNWLNSNINTDGEYSLGWADCEQTCIVMARDAGCDIANYGDHSCWCQFGSDQGEDHNDWYHSCFLGEHCDNNGYDCETMECGDDSGSSSGSWSSSSDSDEGHHYVNIDGQQYYDYIHLQEFDNDYCNGYERHTQDFPMHECTCNFDPDGTPYCVEPLYSSMSIVEINFYLGYDCSSSSMMMMNQQFPLNSCMEGTLLTGHHKDDLYENFFIRMLRGSGLKGLTSFADPSVELEDNFRIIRPLIKIQKKKLIYISKSVFNFFVKDPSNESLSFQRSRIRKLILNLENEGLDKKKLDLTIDNLKSADLDIKIYVEENIKNNAKYLINNNKYILNQKFFFGQGNEVIFRSFSEVLRKVSGKYYPPRGIKIKDAISKCMFFYYKYV